MPALSRLLSPALRLCTIANLLVRIGAFVLLYPLAKMLIPDMEARTARLQEGLADCVRLGLEEAALRRPHDPALAQWTGGLVLSGHTADTLHAATPEGPSLLTIPFCARQQAAALLAQERAALGPVRWWVWGVFHNGMLWHSHAPRLSAHARMALHARIEARRAPAAPSPQAA